MASATYGELLRNNRYFRHLWTGQVISELGSWFSFIAELGLVRQMSGSPLATTALMIGRTLPFLLVAPFAGVFADRLSRKRILLWTDVIRALVALFYLYAATSGAVWFVVLCSFVMQSLTMFFDAAKNAALPNLVSQDELLTANVMSLSTRFLQYTLGAALGGATAAQFGYNAAFIANAISFLGSALFIALIPGARMKKATPALPAEDPATAGLTANQSVSPADTATAFATTVAATAAPATVVAPAPEEVLLAEEQQCAVALATDADDFLAATSVPEKRAADQRAEISFFTDVREGLKYIWGTTFVRGVIMVNVGWALGGGMPTILFDRIGGHLFAGAGRGDWNVAALFASTGAGVFIGMLLARRIGDWLRSPRQAGHYIGWSLIVHGVLFAIGGLMPTLAWMGLFIGLSRVLLGAEFGVQETMVMRVTPDEYRGRVFTTDRSLEFGMMTVSMAAAGYLLTIISPRATMVISGLLSAIPGVVWLLTLWLTNFRIPARAIGRG